MLEYLKIIAEHSPAISYAKDTQGRYIYCNRKMLELTGRTDSDVSGLTDADLVPPPLIEACVSSDRKVIETGRPHAFEEVWTTDEGPRSYYTQKFPIKDAQGKVTGIVGITADLSEKTRSMRDAKMRALGEFSAGVAHEINNPLAIIQVQASLLGKLPPTQKAVFDRCVGAIQASVGRIATIVTALRRFAGEELGAGWTPVRVSTLLDETLSLCREKFRSHGVDISVASVPPHLTVECHPTEIKEALLSLLVNAYEASANIPGSWIRLEAADEFDTVTLSVIDSGTGLSSLVQEKIFQPFFTTKTMGEGLGMGLSLAKGIVEGHGGTLSYVAAAPNTCFRIRLPKKQG